jgi:hypothetical protein
MPARFESLNMHTTTHTAGYILLTAPASLILSISISLIHLSLSSFPLLVFARYCTRWKYHGALLPSVTRLSVTYMYTTTG